MTEPDEATEPEPTTDGPETAEKAEALIPRRVY
jgi:hypothetical protein